MMFVSFKEGLWAMNKSEAQMLVAQAWCQPETSNKVMDTELAEAFVEILLANQPSRISAEDRVKLATRTEAPVTPEMIARFSDPETIRIFHYIAGLVTEAGEALDQLKRHLFYGKPLDKINLKEELGDTDWYMNLGCSVLDTNMQEVEIANIRKLTARFGDKFSEDAALIRNLDNERKVLEENLPAFKTAEPNEICRPPKN
jgi:NTP pyrophosphatase (non-canonical NTP hydrolase)